MSLGANDFLGTPKKPGVFDYVELHDLSQVINNLAVFDEIRDTSSKILTWGSQVATNQYDTIRLIAPGMYFVEWDGLSASGGAHTLYLGSNAALTGAPSFSTGCLLQTSQPANTPIHCSTIIPAKGGEELRIYCSSALTGNSDAYFRVTYLG